MRRHTSPFPGWPASRHACRYASRFTRSSGRSTSRRPTKSLSPARPTHGNVSLVLAAIRSGGWGLLGGGCGPPAGPAPQDLSPLSDGPPPPPPPLARAGPPPPRARAPLTLLHTSLVGG